MLFFTKIEITRHRQVRRGGGEEKNKAEVFSFSLFEQEKETKELKRNGQEKSVVADLQLHYSTLYK